MALLKLNDVGKIYVSDGNVAVGIRGVNLSFDRGEFVAVTGQSGSGKSTLLNVISGMDSYEEGEMYIEGQPTSHYMQPDWEDYRQKYISFIFQDYNIIESFTVLQNVELALMHIEDKKERRRRAMELIDRVGLSSHVKQKGSKLSGGQKQRTVIARALAKDSPIILADEPTGNLDSATSAEIVELLREVSKDKLLIVVTHNFEEVERCATRHVRVFDGAVESDRVLSAREPEVNVETVEAESPIKSKSGKKKIRKKDIRNGVTLGCSIFTSKPKLSTFLCILMVVATLGVFFVTSLCGDATDMFEKSYMFETIEGRVILTKQNGEVLGEERVKALAEEYGAEDYLTYDILLDKGYECFAEIPGEYEYFNFVCTYGEDFGEDIIGRYPTAADEVFLYLPISYQKHFGKDTLTSEYINVNDVSMKVTGVKYYIDNNILPRCLYTPEGFRNATAVYYLLNNSMPSVVLRATDERGAELKNTYFHDFVPSYAVEEGKIYLASREFDSFIDSAEYDVALDISSNYHNYNHYYSSSSQSLSFVKSFGEEYITKTMQKPDMSGKDYATLYVSPELLREFAEEVLSKSYKQASLFFEDDEAARTAAEKLNDAGYIAVTSDTTYTPDAFTVMEKILTGVMLAIVWALAIVFLAFFVNLCSGRTIGAFKGDMAIMRSMGIPVRVIRVGMYVRMLISLIPAYITVVVAAILIYTTPTFNGMFTYLYAWQYALIFLGVLLLTVRVTHKQIRRLFGESVKKSLKGGAAND